MTDYEREQRREVERRERMERETVEPMDEPIGVYDRGERVDEPIMGRGDMDPLAERIDPYDRPADVETRSNSGLWMTVGIIVLVVVALIVVMLLLPLL